MLRLICRECYILGTRKHGLVPSVPSARYLIQPVFFYDINRDFCLPPNYHTNEQRYWYDSGGKQWFDDDDLMDPDFQSELEHDWQYRIYQNSRVVFVRKGLPPTPTSFILQFQESDMFTRHFFQQWEMRKLVLAFRRLSLGRAAWNHSLS